MKVEIQLEGKETQEEAEELLFKALQHHRAGEEHKQAFHQPAARDVFNKLIKEHDKAIKDIMKEVEKLLDEEVYG